MQHPTGEITDRHKWPVPHDAWGPPSAEDQALEMLPDPYLKAAMMVLPEQFRIAVYFADIAGYSYKEIAAMTDTRQGTVSSRLNRGRKQLRDLLFDSPADHGPGQSARPRAEQPNSAQSSTAPSPIAVIRHPMVTEGPGAAATAKGNQLASRYMLPPLGADNRAVRADPRRGRSRHGYQVHATRSRSGGADE